MVKDIVPELLEVIEREFNKGISNSKKLKSISAIIENGTATYQQANEYAVEVGEVLANVLKKNINSDVLPDGKMYYNIAERIIGTTLKNNHIIVVKVSAEIQEQLNKSIGLGLKGIEPKVNQLRIDSIINRVVAEEVFDDVSWIIEEPIINFTQSVVDETIKVNVEFQGKSGLNPKIIRSANYSDACDWCKRMEGIYEYPNVPDEVYTRHDRCRCTVEYNPGDNRRQNVWTKGWSG